MGLSILELVQNRFPFPSDLAPVDLIMHITAGEVRPFGQPSDLITRYCQNDVILITLWSPQLEDEHDLDSPWSDAMKDFIALS